MKQRILLLFVMTMVITSLQAQKNKNRKEQNNIGYAITAAEKGGRSWKEVRLVDVSSGAEVKNIYSSKAETEALNARTGKPVEKKNEEARKVTTSFTTTPRTEKKIVNLDQALDKANGNRVTYTRVIMVNQAGSTDKPFATNSAAMAYDKKHERLYYTPMGFNQLRYIDLKTGKIYYFENEEFGTVKGMGDAPNQITRMVIASDGNGYALTNDANHLIRFTTDKKQVITDMGAVSDDAANGKSSVHSGRGYGGDMIADADGNLYLVTANRNVFKINIETRVASYKGVINGLPQGFSTNGAMVEEGSKVIIASSESTVGYYRFDLNTMQAEKVSSSGDVFNASDLANGNLAFAKKKKERKSEETKLEEKPVVSADATKQVQADGLIRTNRINVYPNPVTNGVVKMTLTDQPAGKYQVQLLDLTGKLVSSKEIVVSSESQVEEFRFPELNVKGTYLLRVYSALNQVNVTNKIVVQ